MDLTCKASSNGTVTVGTSASGSSLIGVAGGCDVEQLVSGEGAEGPGHDQIGEAERVEPQADAPTGALRELARGQRRSDSGGDVA
jgi:hypothetical protein